MRQTCHVVQSLARGLCNTISKSQERGEHLGSGGNVALEGMVGLSSGVSLLGGIPSQVGFVALILKWNLWSLLYYGFKVD